LKTFASELVDPPSVGAAQNAAAVAAQFAVAQIVYVKINDVGSI